MELGEYPTPWEKATKDSKMRFGTGYLEEVSPVHHEFSGAWDRMIPWDGS